MYKFTKKTTIITNYLLKKIPFLSKFSPKNQKDQSSQNYNEMVNRFIIIKKKLNSGNWVKNNSNSYSKQ